MLIDFISYEIFMERLYELIHSYVEHHDSPPKYIIMSNELAAKIVKTASKSLIRGLSIHANGTYILFGIKVIRTTDLKQNELDLA